jgi:hypothetical protein
VAILTVRHETYTAAQEANLRRWSRKTRDWSPVASVALNPEREAAATKEENKIVSAA